MLARVEAIKAALGLPPSIVGAIPIVGAASVALGIDVAETAKLPEMVIEIDTHPPTPQHGRAPGRLAPRAPAHVQLSP
jgi:hypothetical protein